MFSPILRFASRPYAGRGSIALNVWLHMRQLRDAPLPMVSFRRWLAAARFTQNLSRQALKVLLVGGDHNVFKAASNF
jgi:hypothetical protein